MPFFTMSVPLVIDIPQLLASCHGYYRLYFSQAWVRLRVCRHRTISLIMQLEHTGNTNFRIAAAQHDGVSVRVALFTFHLCNL